MCGYHDNRGPYETGHLHQRCSKCEWWQSGHGLEVQSCPLCGAPTSEKIEIEFGGVVVAFDGTSFMVGDASATARIDRADYPDVITFMLRHAKLGPVPGNLGALRPIASGVGDYAEKNPRMAGMHFNVLCGRSRPGDPGGSAKR